MKRPRQRRTNVINHVLVSSVGSSLPSGLANLYWQFPEKAILSRIFSDVMDSQYSRQCSVIKPRNLRPAPSHLTFSSIPQTFHKSHLESFFSLSSGLFKHDMYVYYSVIRLCDTFTFVLTAEPPIVLLFFV